MTNTQPRDTRSQQTEEVSRHIREVALQHIAVVGVDGLSMAKVAEDAGFTKSPLYRRYDDAIDLAVDVWDHYLRDHLQKLLNSVASYAESGSAQALSMLAREMSHPSTESKALIECLAASRRYEFLLETVELDVDRELDAMITRLSGMPADVVLSHASFVMGGLFIGTLLPASTSDYENSFAMWHDYLINEDFWLTQEMPHAIHPIPVPVPEEEDPVIGNLVTAAIKVIMRTGFEKATANRIARYANKAFSTSYSYFDSKEELTSYAAAFVFRHSVTRNDVLFGPDDLDRLTQFTAARIRELSTESASEETRLFRIEATLAARHHQPLRKTVQKLFRESLDQLMSVVVSKQYARDDVRLVWNALRVSGFGHNLMGLVSRDYRKVNWMSTAFAAATILRDRAMIHYEGTADELLSRGSSSFA